jgi:hypothetical protein
MHTYPANANTHFIHTHTHRARAPSGVGTMPDSEEEATSRPAEWQTRPAEQQATPSQGQATPSNAHPHAHGAASPTPTEEPGNNNRSPVRGRALRIPEDVAVLDELTSPVFIVDFHPEVDRNVWVNRRCCEIMSKTVEEMVAVDFQEGRSTFVRDLMLDVHEKVQIRGLNNVQMRKTLFYSGVVST